MEGSGGIGNEPCLKCPLFFFSWASRDSLAMMLDVVKIVKWSESSVLVGCGLFVRGCLLDVLYENAGSKEVT